MKLILNPAILYSLLWGSIILLYTLRLSDILLPFNLMTVYFLIGSIAAFLVGAGMHSVARKETIKKELDIKIYKEVLTGKKTEKILILCSVILLISIVAETLYFGNLPFLSIFGIGKQIRYTEFGIRGVHGLFNALYLFIANILFARYLLDKDKKNLVLIILILSWPILMVTRQLFISLFVQLFFIYLLLQNINFSSFFKVFLAFITVIFLFGYIGDLRSGRSSIIALARPTFDYPIFLPSGLLWAYIYIVSPVNNIVNNIYLTPYYFPVSIISGLIPSFARNDIKNFMSIDNVNWNLVNETLNVSSMHQKILSDFGVNYSLFFYILLSFLLREIYIRSFKSPRYGFALVVILHSIILSFFVDFIFHLVFLAQIFFSLVFIPKKLLNSDR